MQQRRTIDLETASGHAGLARRTRIGSIAVLETPQPVFLDDDATGRVGRQFRTGMTVGCRIALAARAALVGRIGSKRTGRCDQDDRKRENSDISGDHPWCPRLPRCRRSRLAANLTSRHHESQADWSQADLRIALSTRVLPSDQMAPGTLWLAAITSSKARSIQPQSSSVMVSGGSSLMVCRPWPATWVRIL
jgi:hypothetical protein